MPGGEPNKTIADRSGRRADRMGVWRRKEKLIQAGRLKSREETLAPARSLRQSNHSNVSNEHNGLRYCVFKDVKGIHYLKITYLI